MCAMIKHKLKQR